MWTLMCRNSTKYDFIFLFDNIMRSREMYKVTIKFYGNRHVQAGFYHNDDYSLHYDNNLKYETYSKLVDIISWKEDSKKGLPDTNPKVEEVLEIPEIKFVLNKYLIENKYKIVQYVFHYQEIK